MLWTYPYVFRFSVKMPMSWPNIPSELNYRCEHTLSLPHSHWNIMFQLFVRLLHDLYLLNLMKLYVDLPSNRYWSHWISGRISSTIGQIKPRFSHLWENWQEIPGLKPFVKLKWKSKRSETAGRISKVLLSLKLILYLRWHIFLYKCWIHICVGGILEKL